MNDIKQLILPITVFTFAALVFIFTVLTLYHYFSNRLAMKSAQSILKDNKDLSPEQIRALFKRNSNSDTRKGFISLSLALASVLCGMVMGSNGYKVAQSSFIGMAMFPGIIGLTYLYLKNKS